MTIARYTPGTLVAIVGPAGAALLSAGTAADVAEAVWHRLRDGSGLGGLLDVLAAGGPLSAVPPFALALHDDGAWRVAVRGSFSVTGLDETIDGAGATTWSERTLRTGDTVTLAAAGGTDAAADASRPLRDGIVGAAALTITGDGVGRAPLPSSPARTAPLAAPAEPVQPHSIREVHDLDQGADGVVAGAGAGVVAATAAAQAATIEAPSEPEPGEPESPEPETGPAEAESAETAVEPAEPGSVEPDDPESEPGSVESEAESAEAAAEPAEPAPPVDPEGASESRPAPADEPDPAPGMIDAVPRTAPLAAAATAPVPAVPADAPLPPLPPLPDEVEATVIRGAAPAAEAAEADEGEDDETISLAEARALRAAGALPPVAPPLAAPAPPAAAGVLRVSSGASVLLDRTVIIGRRPRSTRVSGPELPHLVAVDSPQQDISRNHVEVRVEGDTILATDLHTTNGTTLLRTGAEPVRLHPGEATLVVVGDVLDLGDGIRVTVEAAP